MTSSSSSSVLGHAEAIIERFGGIRPMATKLGVPVTTVQGWKQRGAIPAARRDDILRAAAAHQVSLEGLILDIPDEPKASSAAAPPSGPAPAADEAIDVPVFSTGAAGGAPTGSIPARAIPTRAQDVRMPLIVAGVVLIAAGVIGSVVAVAPKVKVVSAQQQRIDALEAEVARMKAAQGKTGGDGTILPEGVAASISDLQTKVQDLSAQAQSYAAAVQDLKSGTLTQRLAKLEGHMNSFLAQANALGLQNMVSRVAGLQQSSQGTGVLNSVVERLLGVIAQPEGEARPKDMTAALAHLREKDPDVATVFDGVAPEDMKAAAMLLGLAQLRESLGRDHDSFDQDLALLKTTVAQDDPELQAAIDRLAPRAKEGVLTPDGLSKEFKALAGEVVVASLSGGDVSLGEKAKARLGQVLSVEKDGVPVSGTATQIKVAEAQKKLDQGDIEGAMQILQGLQGSAAERVAPFLDQAQATLLANQVQQLLGQGILRKLQLGGGVPYVVNSGGIGGIVRQVEGLVPGQGMVRDPASGSVIYVQPKLPGHP